ncbi:hypothetical protein AKO1_009559 [Acrasis kona]|uniref:Uncharacterized protein n=1 Tax=Acrasis kona TaxID=1008807 RepID=A0AAW2ZLV9_9EUKA
MTNPTTQTTTTNVVDKPVLGGIIEKQNVEVIHKPVVQEIHEQKVIELEKQNVVKNIVHDTIHEQARASTVYEEVGTRDAEAERLRLAQLNLQTAPVVTHQSGATHEVRQGEVVAQVVRQEHIEHHVQPVITEVHEQNVVQEVVHPVVRKIHDETIIREVPYTQDTGRFDVLDVTHAPRVTPTQAPIVAPVAPVVTAPLVAPLSTGAVAPQNRDQIRTLSCAGKNYIYGLSYAGELYRLAGSERTLSWEFLPTEGMLFKDISVARGGHVFGIGLNNGFLYRLNNKSGYDLVLPEDIQRLSQVAAQSKRKIYALAEDGSVLFLKLARFGHNNVWERLGGKLKKISVGGKLLRRTEVWGIGLDNRAYRYLDGQWIPFNVLLTDLSVATDNAVYGVDQGGRLLKWNGADMFGLQERELTGDRRVVQQSILSNVTAYKEGTGVYGIEKGTGNVLKMLV